jgi:pimeloyl-ACP methyl ester carboxylesterase
MKARVLAGDVAAYKAFFTSGASYPDPLDQVPPTIGVPCLIFVGEDDFALEAAVKAAKEIPNAALVTLPGLDHPQGFMHAELVLPHLRAFLEDLTS